MEFLCKDDPTAAEFQRLLEEIESFEKDQQVAESAILVPQLSNSTQKRRRKKRGKYKPRGKCMRSIICGSINELTFEAELFYIFRKETRYNKECSSF